MVNHLNKGAGSALNRSMGSIAFVAAVRSAWAVVADQEDPRRRFFLALKSNLAPDSRNGLAYSVIAGANGHPRISWESEPVMMTADEAMAPRPPRREPTKLERVEEWLESCLANGAAIDSTELERRAAEAGFSRQTLRRAKDSLGVQATKAGGFGAGGKWTWSLPVEDERTSA
jgi:putative DNA primase/helicase